MGIQRELEFIKENEYLRGWHDALRLAYNESYTVTTEQGTFKVVQIETIIGLGLAKDEPIHEVIIPMGITLYDLQAMRQEVASRLYQGVESTAFTWQNLGVNMCLEIIDKYIAKAKEDDNDVN